MNCKDFTLELTKRKDDLNSSVQSLCTTVIQLKDDNRRLEKENSQFRNEIYELKTEIDNLKKDMKLIKEILFPVKEEDKYKEILSESKIIKSIEEKKLILK
jgi:predicted nuclease with TOPRIM domain